ncbi:MAG: DUF1906 domain-containing protein [Polyangiaceae bacterium]
MQSPLSRRRFLFASTALGVSAIGGCSLDRRTVALSQGQSSAPSSTPTESPQTTESSMTPSARSSAGRAPETRHYERTGFPQVADTALRLDAKGAQALRAAGVRTLFRYYCHLPASIPGKDLQPEEARILFGEGLSIAAVFQHYSNCFLTFENRWGKEDAQRALEQAATIGQPTGSAIYFAVDADWPYDVQQGAITEYFEAVNKVFERTGFAVGVYSNGCVCNLVRTKGLATYAWLSASTGHSGTQAYFNSGAWTLYQNAVDITPDALGFAVDTSLVNPASSGYFGQFDEAGTTSAAHAVEDARALLEERRFLRSENELRAKPKKGAKSFVTLKKDQNVRLLEAKKHWSKVLTQEGGDRRNGAESKVGWIENKKLSSMDAFPDNVSTFGLCGSTKSPDPSFKDAHCERALSRRR